MYHKKKENQEENVWLHFIKINNERIFIFLSYLERVRERKENDVNFLEIYVLIFVSPKHKS